MWRKSVCEVAQIHFRRQIVKAGEEHFASEKKLIVKATRFPPFIDSTESSVIYIICDLRRGINNRINPARVRANSRAPIWKADRARHHEADDTDELAVNDDRTARVEGASTATATCVGANVV